MDVHDRAEELASELGVDGAEVARDLENLLAYSVPADEAVQSLRRKYGDEAGGEPGDARQVEIGAITTDGANVTVTARILTVGKRSIRYEGDEQVIVEGELGDSTGTISYTSWRDFEFAPGDSIRIENANVREWEGEPELNLGERTTFSRLDETVEAVDEPGGDSTLAEMRPGDRGRNVDVRVIEVESKVIDGRDGETEILSGVVGDETARLPFTDWDPHPAIESDASLRLENVYVREFRGVPSVNVSEFSRVSPVETTVEPAAARTYSIREAVETGGAFDVALAGTVVGIRDGSGLIQRCPECGRIVQKGRCRTHGNVDGVDDLRVKAILDDGTGTVTAVLDDKLTATVYGGGIDDALEAAREAMDQSVVTEVIEDRIIGREYRVRGNLSVDEYGANLEASGFDAVEDDPTDRARSFLEAVR